MVGFLVFPSSHIDNCDGGEPMPSVETYLGMDLDFSIADTICCHNHHFAEPRGYLETVRFFEHVDSTRETIYYDSVCGLPLFVAPRGRSFAEYEHESIHHGWPSFRPAEIISENVIIHEDGRMESACGTHLGHNLPDGDDRYCIDLLCMAGTPFTSSPTSAPSVSPAPTILDRTNSPTIDGTFSPSSQAPGEENTAHHFNYKSENYILAENFNASNYVSSADTSSGKTTADYYAKRAGGGVLIFLIALIWCFGWKRYKSGKLKHHAVRA